MWLLLLLYLQPKQELWQVMDSGLYLHDPQEDTRQLIDCMHEPIGPVKEWMNT